MKIRVGLSHVGRAVLDKVSALSAPVLVSANSLWNDKRKRFSSWRCYHGFDVALDSGGFVAMNRYGGYRWSIADYVALAGAMAPSWWAQMDFCCEPEIASTRAEVLSRIDRTVHHLRECQNVAAGEGVSPPMPVLQGWLAEDYVRGPAFDERFTWPDLVGVGSVCRRHLHGPDGILTIMEALHDKVPGHVQFHLFGVKSQAIGYIQERWPGRVASMDSMAWDVAARWDGCHAGAYHPSMRPAALEKWYLQQLSVAKPSQLVFHW